MQFLKKNRKTYIPTVTLFFLLVFCQLYLSCHLIAFCKQDINVIIHSESDELKKQLY